MIYEVLVEQCDGRTSPLLCPIGELRMKSGGASASARLTASGLIYQETLTLGLVERS